MNRELNKLFRYKLQKQVKAFKDGKLTTTVIVNWNLLKQAQAKTYTLPADHLIEMSKWDGCIQFECSMQINLKT